MKTRVRWASIPDITDLVLGRTNKLAERLKSKSRRAQLQAVRRLVKRAERRDEVRITKRLSGDIFVRLDAVESLLPADAATVTRLEVAVTQVVAENRRIWTRLGAQSAKLREHDQKIGIVTEKQDILQTCVTQLLEVERRTKGS